MAIEISHPSQSKHLTHPKYRADIDGLRAIAILSVIGYHAFPEWINGGFIGVDIFFVISGFLISTIIFENLDRNSFSFTEFYSRRVKRIFPALLVVLIASLVFGWFELMADEYQELGKHISGGAAFVSNLLLWKESGYFDNTAETKPLLHLWSLGIEEQFYIIWPLLLWVAWKKRFNLLLLTVVISAISFVMNVVLVQKHTVASFYSPQTRFWELLVGSILAYISTYKQIVTCKLILQNSNCQSLCGALLIGIGFVFITKERSFPGWWALLPTVGAALIISAGSQAWLNRAVLSNRLLVWIGLISFPLYLWHWPLLSFAHIVQGEVPAPKTRVAVVLTSILFAWLTYKFIEKPARFGKHIKWITTSLVVAMVTLGLVGYYCYKMNGLDSRFPNDLRTIARTVDFNWGQYVRSGTCHLQEEDLLLHDISCFEITRPLIALWGDSHASSLYPGLKKLQEKVKFGVAQLTTAGCPPVFNASDFNTRKNCNDVNKTVLNKLANNKPDILIITSAWMIPEYRWTNEELISNFSNTLDSVKEQFPKTKIIVIGPVPHWKISPQKQYFDNWRSMSGDKSTLRLQATTLKDIDYQLGKLTKAKGSIYISSINILCNESGCLARVGNQPADLIARDYGHFSKSGAEYFIDKIKNEIFSDLTL